MVIVAAIWAGSVHYGEQKHGNTVANISNYGFTAKQGLNTYYVTYRGGIFRHSENGATDIKISDDKAAYINVVDDWLYYTASEDGKRPLCKIKTDGSQRTQLIDNIKYGIFVSSNWVYYTSEKGLYRMDIEGSETQAITTDNECSCIGVFGEWIYYIKHDNYQLMRIKSDGTDNQLILDKVSGGLNVSMEGGWIYYVSDESPYGIYRVKHDGSAKALVLEAQASCLNVTGNRIFYSKNGADGGIYQSNLDGTNIAKVANGKIMAINVSGDWVYFLNMETPGYYRVKSNGSDLVCIENNEEVK